MVNDRIEQLRRDWQSRREREQELERANFEEVAARLIEEGRNAPAPSGARFATGEPPLAERLGIPPLFHRADIDDFADFDFQGGPPALSDRRSLLIVGANGRGKSHLAAAVAKLWRARWCSASHFVVEARSSFGRGEGESELGVLLRYSEPECLVLDDLTAVNRSPHAVATLLALLDRRIGWMRPTVVTCYQSRGAVAEFDPSIASRIGGFERVVLVGEDRRGKSE